MASAINETFSSDSEIEENEKVPKVHSNKNNQDGWELVYKIYHHHKTFQRWRFTI